MKETTSREQILKRVRNASLQKAENPYSSVDLEKNIYRETEDELEIVFAEELNLVGGHFVYCQSLAELQENLSRLIKGQQWDKVYAAKPGIQNILKSIGITSLSKIEDYKKVEVTVNNCEALVARLGSVLISSKQLGGRRINFVPNTQIIIADRNQIVATVKEAMALMEERYNNKLPSMITLISGPSRTADIEKTLVMGAHGPQDLIVFLTEEDLLNETTLLNERHSN